MKKLSVTVMVFYILNTINSQGQNNCSNPEKLDICPSITQINQTNGGMVDDAPSGCNLPGEDVVYEIHAVNGADKLFYAITGLTGAATISVQTTCGSSFCQSQNIGPGNTNGSFTVASSNYYYLWIDAPSTITYNIAFGADTGSVYINIPNTRGNLQFDWGNCGTPLFTPSKPYFQVSYNGIYQTKPMTLSPLFTPGMLCVKTFFKNNSGIEGIRKFVFHFNPLGFPVVAASPATVTGNYNAGTWISSVAGDSITFTFNDALGIGKGDFLIPGSCLEYEFCFNVIPISNDPALANVNVMAYSDGFGYGFSGYIRSGCCPVLHTGCISSMGAGLGAGAATAFGFGFDDPGTLPVELVYFDAYAENNSIVLNWETASELNNDYFLIEQSTDAELWTEIGKVKGAGNSNTTEIYRFTDNSVRERISYYRLKQVDFNGDFAYSPVKKVIPLFTSGVAVRPNPASEEVRISGVKISLVGVTRFDGRVIELHKEPDESNEIKINTANWPSGLYVLKIEKDRLVIYKKLVIAHP